MKVQLKEPIDVVIENIYNKKKIYENKQEIRDKIIYVFQHNYAVVHWSNGVHSKLFTDKKYLPDGVESMYDGSLEPINGISIDNEFLEPFKDFSVKNDQFVIEHNINKDPNIRYNVNVIHNDICFLNVVQNFNGKISYNVINKDFYNFFNDFVNNIMKGIKCYGSFDFDKKHLFINSLLPEKKIISYSEKKLIKPEKSNKNKIELIKSYNDRDFEDSIIWGIPNGNEFKIYRFKDKLINLNSGIKKMQITRINNMLTENETILNKNL